MMLTKEGVRSALAIDPIRDEAGALLGTKIGALIIDNGADENGPKVMAKKVATQKK